jgi:L-ascorbate metabolism protein UlaG (beta-lactamase superfamily)
MTLEIKWLGHSWFRITADEVNLDFDPLSKKYVKKLGVTERTESSKKSDFILVSHSHGDHWNLETIRSLSGPQTVIVAPRKPANRIGEGVRVIEAGQKLSFDKLSLLAIPAYNLRKIYHRRGKGVGYLVTIGGKVIYHAGDTDFIPEMNTLGKVDVAMLPIGGRVTMDVNDAANAAKAISPRLVIPMHNRDTDPKELARILQGFHNVRVEPMVPGQVIELKDV